MTYFGFDHHKRWTQTVAMDQRGGVLREGRVLNDSGSLKTFLTRIAEALERSS
jgi:hypothetical protein